ncbi:adenosine deaminase [Litorilinea aerophila]|uniref:Adenosine deaminase n=1 Tax=Litorilinea aerophila TaxID=1204385 RepID=A0A540V8L1_9CHLR|nr:adenosine deaminase [Litorilinea aerophila]MCC9079002.1 adenosine deaminase [Litorilinea aerophila]
MASNSFQPALPPNLDPDLAAWIQAMPKAELHIHLEGSIQPETLLELARRHGRVHELPSDDLAELRRWFVFRDFPHFVEIYLTISNLLRTPEDFALIVHACGADMAAQNIRYRELTVTPFTHTDLQQKGLTLDDLLEGLEAGRVQARRDFGVEMRWIFDIPRNVSFQGPEQRYDPGPAERTLAYALAGRDYGVIGFGLGGYEVGAPPEPFAHAFRAAKEAGLLSVPHAGETLGPESVWGALDALQADRIGHGVRAMEDPALLTVLRDRAIPLEVNLTSNICLHVYPRLAGHPFPHLDRMGLILTVNSDDPPLFNTDLCREYALLATEFGYGRADLARLARNAFQVSGAPPALKERLLAEFDRWAQQGEL